MFNSLVKEVCASVFSPAVTTTVVVVEGVINKKVIELVIGLWEI